MAVHEIILKSRKSIVNVNAHDTMCVTYIILNFKIN